ncbi:unnamed protein product [Lymnaea stagnalis]|uniref:G-protein coupled receptors family 1 profile domain-containing protein n=1 Tax=Lymnaea stagnalis TaxID=6523 RepID=A0AAV2IE22_LYMST
MLEVQEPPAMMFNTTPWPSLNVTEDKAEEKPGLRVEVIVVSVVLSFFCVFGTVGNAMAFFIYYRKREKGTSTIFILSLAVTDFFTCLVAMPFTIASEILDFHHVYDIVCKVYLFVQTFNIPLSSLIMVAIGFDRYFCICHPFLHVVTVPRAKWCVVILTLISALMAIIPMLSHGVYYPELRHENVTGDSNVALSSSVSPSDIVVAVTTTTMSTNGLFLEPEPGFISDLVGHGVPISYKTDNVNNLPSTLVPLAASPRMSLDISSGDEIPRVANTSLTKNVVVWVYHGTCTPSNYTLSNDFVAQYLKIYASTYLVEFIVLAMLYGLIYRSILVRRAWKNKRKRTSCYASTNGPETVAEETQLTNINGTATETVLLKTNSGRMSTAMRDRALYANIKTAAMLFVVTVVFVISFLPSWLMGLKLFPFVNTIVFYMFYINNVVNPIIYAFMNRAFRDDLLQLLRACFRR